MEVSFRSQPGRIDFKLRGSQFTSYHYGGAAAAGFSTIYAAPGRAVTAEENGRSVWLEHGCASGEPDGGCGAIVPGEIEARRGPLSIGFRQKCMWKRVDGSPLLKEERSVRLCAAASEGANLDISVRLTADDPARLEPSRRGILSVRIAPALLPGSGAQVWSSAGRGALEDIHGMAVRWCAAQGVVAGEAIGIAVLDHPENPGHPAPWTAASDGLLCPGGFGWRTVSVERGPGLRLRYRIVVFRGVVGEGWPEARYAEFADPNAYWTEPSHR